MEKRNQSDARAANGQKRRHAYRRAQTRTHHLSLSVRTPSGQDHPGSLEDLSIGGACAKFAVNEKTFTAGQIVVLTIGSLTRTSRVIAKARVAFSHDSEGGRRCGFQFTEPAVLFPQIDGFYARFFNRRKSERVSMPLDKKIPVQLGSTGAEIKAELVDLSIEGMQVRMKRVLAKELDGANHASLRFKLPGQDGELTGRGAILRRTQSGDTVTLGLEFDLQQEQGISKHLAALSSWIVHRAHEISKWDSALSKQEGPAGNEAAKRAAVIPHWERDSTLPRRLT